MPLTCLSNILIGLHSRLHDDADPDSVDVSRCGQTSLFMLRQVSSRLATGSVALRTAGDSEMVTLDTLLALAHERINTVDFHNVESCWLRLSTDASIMRTALDLYRFDVNTRRDDWLAATRRLDMATIVAGGIGAGRSQWITSLLKEIQRTGLSRDDSLVPVSPRPLKRARLAEVISRPSERSMYASNTVPTRDPPTMDVYARNLSSSPFIVPRYANDPESGVPPWPAIHRWQDPTYLLDAVGEGRVVPIEIGRAYSDAGWGQRIMPFRDFLSRVGYDVQPESLSDEIPDEPLYLAQHSLFNQFPELEKDFSVPDYVWADPEPDADSGFQPIPNAQSPIINVWIGNSSDHPISPAHTDPHFNCYVQVLGCKRVWLAPPTVSRYMTAYGDADPRRDGELRKDDDVDDDGHDLVHDEDVEGDTRNDRHDSKDSTRDPDEAAEEGELSKYMSNTSRVPILREDAPSVRSRYPAFFEHVAPVAMEAVLTPGDLLVMPPGWWHAMKGEGQGPSWSISMWY